MQDVMNVKVTPLAPAGGALIEGVDLSREQPQRTIDTIKAAWDKHLVIVFRNQKMTQEQQLAFAARFGELGQRRQAPTALATRTDGTQQTDNRVLLVTNIKVDGKSIGAFGDGEFWFHIDSGYNAKPYLYTFLHGVELPRHGTGNTKFANMYMAYDAVPAALKQRLTDKKALHVHEYLRSERVDLTKDLSGSPHYFHPVFARHPHTGKNTLFVDRLMTQRIEGLEPGESEAVLEQLYVIGERPEHIYEHVWQLGDVVAWDNRATIHARTWFDPSERRLLRRCTVEGGSVEG